MKRLLVLFFAMTLMTSCEVNQSQSNNEAKSNNESKEGSANTNEEDDGPWNYQEAIEDGVRYIIASCNVIIDIYYEYSESYADDYVDRITNDFGDYMDERWSEETENKAYLNILMDIVDMPDHMYYSIANKVLKEYYDTSVILSDYKPIKTSSYANAWEFSEIKTGIKFWFIVDKNDKWTFDVDAESVTRYYEKYLD